MNTENITGACARLEDRTIKLFLGDPVTVTDRLSISNHRTLQVRSHIKQLMDVINDRLYLWGERNPLLESGDMFNGSSEHLMNPELMFEIENVKDSFGDIDVIVPKEKLDDISTYLDLIDDGKTNWTPSDKNRFTDQFHYIGRSKGGYILPDQVFTFWWYKPQDIIVQIDFEGDPSMFMYDNGHQRFLHPSEWMKFSKMSPWVDLKDGIKGLAGAILLRSLTRVTTKLENVVVLTPGGVQNFIKGKEITEKNISKSKQHETPCEFTLNTGGGNQGIRRPYTWVTNLTDGRDAYSFIESKKLHEYGEDYQPITDLEKIFEVIFKVRPTDDDIVHFREFRYLLGLMKRHFSPDQNKEVLNRFYEILEGEHLNTTERHSIDDCVKSCFTVS